MFFHPKTDPCNTFHLLRFFSLLLVAFFLTLFFFSCSPVKRTISPQLNDRIFNKTIRVLLDELPKTYSIKLKEGGYVKNASDEIIQIEKNTTVGFNLANGFITADAGKRTFISNNFEIFLNHSGQWLEHKGKKYRGGFKLVPSKDKLMLINELFVEDYLKGVLPLEMGNIKGDGNFEALKAFSIIARNFCYMKSLNKTSLFDVYPDTRDQVYGGSSVEKELSNKAIEETKGMILTYEHSPAKVFYFSSCGGYTEDVGNVFSEKDIPYLVTVRDEKEPNCKIAPGFNWIERYNSNKIVKRLLENKLIEDKDYKCTGIKINTRFKSGRVNELLLQLETSDGEPKDVKIYSNNIRKIIKTGDGSGILRSTMFDVESEKSDNGLEFVIKGKGNGHGVGLCQWGAIAKSREGAKYSEILYFYFPGTRIEKIND